MSDPIDFYTTHSLITAPGSQAQLLDGLPGDIALLCQVVQSVMIHIFWAGHYGVQLSDGRKAEVQLRSVALQLERIGELDPRPLAEAREPDRRLVGNCRDFSVMLTALLRQQGVPARARCGFARYFIPDHFEDHWVCEVWNAIQRRWVLVDAQLDALQADKLGIGFNPLDVPRGEFIVGGKAWQMCRLGQADPHTFGIADLHGLWFVRGDLVRDVAALNKMELLPWDGWGLIEGRDDELSADDLAALDDMAELTSGMAPEFERMCRIYKSDARWRVPGTIRSYTGEGVKTIDLKFG